jgi:pyridoxal phosphate enzyme (YggS family)
MLKENLDQVFDFIKSGNNLGEPITLVGATKTVSVDVINQSIEYGLKCVAENKVNEFREKTDFIKGASQHFIGHLQTNKAKYLVGKVDLIHSIDSFHLAKAVSDCAVKKGVNQDILVQINIGREQQKGGLDPDFAIEGVKEIATLSGLNVRGIMTMFPLTDDTELIENLCLKMRQIFDILKKELSNFDFLSMGMSKDYKIAVKNGSNMIRLGSVIFGNRNYGGKD